MKHIRITMAVFITLGIMMFAAPTIRAQEPTTKQAAAMVAVNLGYFTYQAHMIKEMRTAQDTDLENALQQAMEAYSNKLDNVTVADLKNGNLPEFDVANVRKVTTAFIANQKEFSTAEIDMATAQEATSMLLQQLAMSALMQ